MIFKGQNGPICPAFYAHRGRIRYIRLTRLGNSRLSSAIKACVQMVFMGPK